MGERVRVARPEQEFGALGGIAEQAGDTPDDSHWIAARPQLVHSTRKAIAAWSAKAAPTTRRRIALRLVDTSQASARMATIPATPSSF